MVEELKEYLSERWDARYLEPPRVACKLEYAFKMNTGNTNIRPFIIAHECNESYLDKDGERLTRKREYYVFHDVLHYIQHMEKYSHAHEVVHGISEESELSGRLVFDFDIKDRKGRKHWVDDSFEEDVDRMVRSVLEEFYMRVDVSLIQPTWLTCKHADKYSRHLVYKGVYFPTEWVKQLRVFYLLCSYIMERDDMFRYMGDGRKELIDQCIARNHATLRMPFSSKLGGNPMEIDRWKGPESFFDALIQVHLMDYSDGHTMEQFIEPSQLHTSHILKLYGGGRGSIKSQVRRVSHKKEESMVEVSSPSASLKAFHESSLSGVKKVVLTPSSKKAPLLFDESLEKVLSLVGIQVGQKFTRTPTSEAMVESIIKVLRRDKELMSMFTITSHSQGFINLARNSRSKCLISGKVHERRPGFVMAHGNAISLYCRNHNCRTSCGKSFIVLYMK
jgi:predicted DNA-binding protein